VCQLDTASAPRRPIPSEGATQFHYLRNAGLMFDPWIKVWQLVQGVISDDPALIE
jgi:hypothetical protein